MTRLACWLALLAVVPARAEQRLFRADGFQRPESVLYDAEHDRYLVSDARAGEIVVLGTDGKVQRPAFITGLQSPHGSGISDRQLYVADRDRVRVFELAGGRAVATLPIAGATFLIERGKVRALARGRELQAPNGLAVVADGVLVLDGAGQLYRLDWQGRRRDVVKLPGSTLDGIVVWRGRLLVSDWETSCVYAGGRAGPFVPLLRGLKTPADIGLDARRGRLLVPLISQGAVEVYRLD